MLKILQNSIYIFLFAFSCLFSFSFAHAQLRDVQEYVTKEDVAIAFYKTGEIQPNLDNWIELSEPYQSTPWARRGLMMESEKKRLQSKLRDFEVTQSNLRLRTFAKINLEEKQEIDEAGDPVEKYYMDIIFLNSPDAFYFPYQYADKYYALMPFGLQEMMRDEISKEEYNYYDDITNSNTKYSFVINLRAREAMTEHPYDLDGREQWILKTNIASAELWSDRNNLVWEYTAPWYVSPQLKELQDIFDLKQKQKKENQNNILNPYSKQTE